MDNCTDKCGETHLAKSRETPRPFKVTITETLKLIVEVEAENQQDAEQIVSDNWRNSKYILDSENFAGVEFEVVPTE